MRPLLALSLAAGGALALGACTEPPMAPDLSSDTAPRTSAKVDGGRTGSGHARVSRFEIDLEAIGPFVPGKPIRLKITTTNKLELRGAQVSLLSPDASVARRNGWKHGRGVVGMRIPSDYVMDRVMSAGSRAVDHASVVIEAPGLYRFIAIVQASPDAPVMDRGRLVQNALSRTIWVYVDATGGRTLSDFDPSVLPSNAITAPGPTLMLAPICESIEPCGPPPEEPPSSPATQTVEVMYLNTDEGHNGLEVLQNVNVRISDYPYGPSYSGQTDNAGRFSAPCPASLNGRQRIIVTLSTPGQFQIQDYTSSAVLKVVDVVTPAGSCIDGGTARVESFDHVPSWLHQQMLATVAPSRALFQISRGFVGVNFDRTSAHEGTSLYRPELDEIVMAATHVFREWGRFVVSHEYGHAFAEQSLGGTRAGGCPAPHELFGEYSMTCALSEGWADYFSAIVRRYEVPRYYSEFLRNAYYYGGDGSKVEGALANFLLALSTPDPMVTFYWEPDRALHYPASYVASSLRDCRVLYNGPGAVVWIRASQTDELIWCFEGGVDWSVYGPYFMGRGPNSSFWPVGQYNPVPRPGNWSQVAIRRTWLKSLYGI